MQKYRISENKTEEAVYENKKEGVNKKIKVTVK